MLINKRSDNNKYCLFDMYRYGIITYSEHFTLLKYTMLSDVIITYDRTGIYEISTREETLKFTDKLTFMLYAKQDLFYIKQQYKELGDL